MSDRHETSDEMFRLPPVSLLRIPSYEEEGEGSAAVDLDTESEMGEAEDDLRAVPSMDTSSAVPASLLYLSDQVREKTFGVLLWTHHVCGVVSIAFATLKSNVNCYL